MATKEQKTEALEHAIVMGKEYARSTKTSDFSPGNVIKDTYEKILELIEERDRD